MKIFSWNVNGIRAVINKGLWEKFVLEYNPDIICLQETKASKEQLAKLNFGSYHLFSSSAERAGYSGTAILVKDGISVLGEVFRDDMLENNNLVDNYGDLTKEGRITAIELEKFFIVSVYTPNSKNNLSRLGIRKNWDSEFLKFVVKLRKVKPVIFAGDLNVAHMEIDLARPKENEGKHGYTIEERAGFVNILTSGFEDSFRKLHPEMPKYSWWTHWGNARQNNVGWRIDYIMVNGVDFKEAEIHNDQQGSDHCPVSITI